LKTGLIVVVAPYDDAGHTWILIFDGSCKQQQDDGRFFKNNHV
jgi:hypothetical protein